MKIGEAGKFRHVAVALLAAVGGSAVAPALASAKKCDVPAAVGELKRHIRNHDTFTWPVADSSDDKEGFVLITSKKKLVQPEYNPLLIRCAGQTLRYVGLTIEKYHALGQTHAVGGGTGLYLAVAKPSEIEVQKQYLNGHSMVVRRPQLQQQIIHPIEPTNIPAFVEQPGDPVLENSYGVSTNGLYYG